MNFSPLRRVGKFMNTQPMNSDRNGKRELKTRCNCTQDEDHPCQQQAWAPKGHCNYYQKPGHFPSIQNFLTASTGFYGACRMEPKGADFWAFCFTPFPAAPGRPDHNEKTLENWDRKRETGSQIHASVRARQRRAHNAGRKTVEGTRYGKRETGNGSPGSRISRILNSLFARELCKIKDLPPAA